MVKRRKKMSFETIETNDSLQCWGVDNAPTPVEIIPEFLKAGGK